MARSSPVKDRLFTALCVVVAVVVLVLGFSRGNPKVALGGAGILVGYAVLQSVARRLTPGARLVIGSEADATERMVQFKATRLAGQVAVALLMLAVLAWVFWDSRAALWAALACATVIATFVGALMWFSGQAKKVSRSSLGR
ncbi:MAG: hypothetical protein WA892_08860 [Ornithinimicrobium sp.]